MTPRQDARGQPPATPRRSPPPAMRHGAPDRVRRRAASRGPPVPSKPAVRLHSLAGTLRMAQLHPPVQRGDPAVASRLVEHRIALYRGGERFRIAFLLDLEGIEARAQHEYELIAQHLSGSAQLAAIMMALPQHARLAVGAAVAEGRKYQSHNLKPVEIRHEIVDVAIIRPDHAGLANAPRKRLCVGEKPRGGNQDRAIG